MANAQEPIVDTKTKIEQNVEDEKSEQQEEADETRDTRASSTSHKAKNVAYGQSGGSVDNGVGTIDIDATVMNETTPKLDIEGGWSTDSDGDGWTSVGSPGIILGQTDTTIRSLETDAVVDAKNTANNASDNEGAVNVRQQQKSQENKSNIIVDSEMLEEEIADEEIYPTITL